MAFDVAIRFNVEGADKAESAIAGVGTAAESAAGKVEPAHRRIRDGVESISTQLDRLKSNFEAFAGISFASMGIGFGAAETLKLADAYTAITSKLRLVTDGTQELARTQDLLFQSSQRNLVPYADTVTLYANLSRGAGELGASQQQLMHFTEGVGAALRLSGSNAQAASGGLLQLSQMMAGPIVQAQEFNSLIDAMPELLRAASRNIDGTGGSIAGLKVMVNEGHLATKTLFEAMLKGSDDLIGQAQGMKMTVGQAWTYMQNELLRYVGVNDQASGASASLAQAIKFVADNIDVLVAAAKGLSAAAIAAQFFKMAEGVREKIAATLADIEATQAQRAATIAGAQAELQATAARSAQAAATQAALVVTREELLAKLAVTNVTIASSKAQIEAAQAAGAQSFALASLRQAEGQLAAAMTVRGAVMAELAVLGQQQVRVSAEVTAATAAQAAAQTGLATATGGASLAARAASGLLGFLGGPIGLVTTALGLGITAWQLWGSAGEKAARDQASAVQASGEQLLAQLKKENDELEKKIGLLKLSGIQVAATNPLEQERINLTARYNELSSKAGETEVEAIVRRAQLRAVTEQLGNVTEELDRKARLQAEADKLNTNTAKALGEVRNKLAGVSDDYVKTLGTLRDAYDKGQLTETEWIKLAQQVTEHTFKKGAATEKLADKYAELIAASDAHVAEMREQLNSTSKLTDSEKKLLDMQAKVEAGTLDFNKAIYAKTAAKLRDNAESERAMSLEELTRKRLEEHTAAVQKNRETLTKHTESIQEQVDKLGDENMKLRLSAEAWARVEAAHDRAMASSARASAQFLEEHGQLGMESEELRRQAALWDELATRKEQRIHLLAAKEAAEEWKKTTDSIGQGLTDSLYRAFESGKGFFETLWSGIKNTFKTTVLKIAVQAVMNPINQGLGGLLGSGNALVGQGGLGGFSVPSSLGDLGSMLSSGWNSLTGLPQSLSLDFVNSGLGRYLGLSNLQDIGGNLVAGPTSAGSSLLSGMSYAGDALGYLGALKAASDGKWGSAIGSGVGTFFGGPIGGAIGGTVGGWVDKAFGGDGHDFHGADYVATSTGGYRPREYEVGDRQYGWSITGARSDDLEKALKGVSDVSLASLNGLSKLFGGADNYKLGTYFSSNETTRNSQGNIRLWQGGSVLSELSSQRYATDPKKGFEEYSQDVVAAVKSAMQAIQLPEWARKQIDALGTGATVEQLAKTDTIAAARSTCYACGMTR